MRKLNVKRKWSIIECGSKIRLFVQCPEDKAQCRFEGVACKQVKLGNGKTVTEEIEDTQVKVFVSSSTMTAEFTVEAGSADVNLLAKPKYNPVYGNPFTIEKI